MLEGSKSSTHYLGDKNRFDVYIQGIYLQQHIYITKIVCIKYHRHLKTFQKCKIDLETTTC